MTNLILLSLTLSTNSQSAIVQGGGNAGAVVTRKQIVQTSVIGFRAHGKTVALGTNSSPLRSWGETNVLPIVNLGPPPLPPAAIPRAQDTNVAKPMRRATNAPAPKINLPK